MNKKQYDFIYLTNTPSFYKLNLCREIAREHSLLLVLYGYGAEAVNTVLTGGEGFPFDYHFLHEGDAAKRSKAGVFLGLLRLMRRVEGRCVLFAGWMAPEYDLYAFLSPRRKNALVCESSIMDVSFRGAAGVLKKAVIRRMGAALPSGRPHDALFEAVGFRGERFITGSVGIFRKGARQPGGRPHSPLRYLYVGRLVAVKNVQLLVEEFNRSGRPLTIVGKGELEDELKAAAKPNVAFRGFVENEKLGEIYQEHDVFVLPSRYEPWGLVVEEALYWGLPVIVSDRVGSSIDMVRELGTGCVFASENGESLRAAVERMERRFGQYRQAASSIDWAEREERQVAAYAALLDQR